MPRSRPSRADCTSFSARKDYFETDQQSRSATHTMSSPSRGCSLLDDAASTVDVIFLRGS